MLQDQQWTVPLLAVSALSNLSCLAMEVGIQFSWRHHHRSSCLPSWVRLCSAKTVAIEYIQRTANRSPVDPTSHVSNICCTSRSRSNLVFCESGCGHVIPGSCVLCWISKQQVRSPCWFVERGVGTYAACSVAEDWPRCPAEITFYSWFHASAPALHKEERLLA